MSFLPVEYKEQMRELLGSEYPAFLSSYEEPRLRGLRVNTLKISPEEFEEFSPFPVRRIPWVDNGFFYSDDAFPARHPYYAAGLYYLQEPSAMTPASRLPVEAGDRVLDLCAAPGGKATELAAKLKGTGILVANEINASRAKALLRNLELFGVKNMAVTNERPERLAGAFPQFFDKILVDAPCSGEGMFRKSPDAAAAWTPSKVLACAKTQREILTQAYRMLRPGGLLLYSTCTFAPEENEQQIAGFLHEYPEMHITPVPLWEGFSQGRPDWADGNPELKNCVRIWPHEMEGEGHFLALLKKDGGSAPKAELIPLQILTDRNMKASKKRKQFTGWSAGSSASSTPEKEEMKQLRPFLGNLSPERVQKRGGSAYYVSYPLPMLQGLHFLRNGIFLGEWKKNRFEPSQPLALALGQEDPVPRLDLSPDDPMTIAFLRGESIRPDSCREEDGWKLITVSDFPIGWGKLTGGQLKNKIGASWRQNSY